MKKSVMWVLGIILYLLFWSSVMYPREAFTVFLVGPLEVIGMVDTISMYDESLDDRFQRACNAAPINCEVMVNILEGSVEAKKERETEE